MSIALVISSGSRSMTPSPYSPSGSIGPTNHGARASSTCPSAERPVVALSATARVNSVPTAPTESILALVLIPTARKRSRLNVAWMFPAVLSAAARTRTVVAVLATLPDAARAAERWNTPKDAPELDMSAEALRDAERERTGEPETETDGVAVREPARERSVIPETDRLAMAVRAAERTLTRTPETETSPVAVRETERDLTAAPETVTAAVASTEALRSKTVVPLSISPELEMEPAPSTATWRRRSLWGAEEIAAMAETEAEAETIE
jgi:leucyl aminopeptidase